MTRPSRAFRFTRRLGWVTTTACILGLAVLSQRLALLPELRAGMGFAASVLTALIVAAATRINARLDHEIDRLDELSADERRVLADYAREQRASITEAWLLGAGGAAVAPAITVFLVQQAASSSVKDSVLDVAAWTCAGIAIVLAVQMARLGGFLGSLDSFHEEISAKLSARRERARAMEIMEREKALPWR